MSVVRVTCSYGYEWGNSKYQATGVSSDQEARKTASLSLTVHVLFKGFSTIVLFEFTDSSVRMFNDMDQTRCPMLLLYGCTCYNRK